MLPAIRHNKPNKFRRPGFSARKPAYSAKSYSNPFFQHKRRRTDGNNFLSSKIKLAASAAIILIIIFVWLVFFSSLFKIKQIQVSGVDGNLAGEVQTIAWNMAGDKLIGKNNLLFFSKNSLRQELNNKYFLANLIIKKKLFHTLTISLQEEKQAAIWREDDKYYYIDNEGNIINQTDPLNINGNIYPLIDNQTNIKIDGRKANIGKVTIDYILILFNELKDNKHNFTIERFIVDQDINTVKVAVLDGPQIYYNTKTDQAEQTAKLDLIIKEKLKDDFKNKEHIDLRFANNVYIK